MSPRRCRSTPWTQKFQWPGSLAEQSRILDTGRQHIRNVGRRRGAATALTGGGSNRRGLMSTETGPMDLHFTAPIGMHIKGDVWSCVEIPDSKNLFGTGKAVKVAATVDGEPVRAALMPTGTGGHMLSVSAKLRKKIGKDIGDDVVVSVSERLS